MVLEKGEHCCTERTTSEYFLKMAKILAFFTKEKALTKRKCFFLEFGGYILSRAVSSQVPSA